MRILVRALGPAEREMDKEQRKLHRSWQMLTSRQKAIACPESSFGCFKYPEDLLTHYDALLASYEALCRIWGKAWHLISTEDIPREDHARDESERVEQRPEPGRSQKKPVDRGVGMERLM